MVSLNNKLEELKLYLKGLKARIEAQKTLKPEELAFVVKEELGCKIVSEEEMRIEVPLFLKYRFYRGRPVEWRKGIPVVIANE